MREVRGEADFSAAVRELHLTQEASKRKRAQEASKRKREAAKGQESDDSDQSCSKLAFGSKIMHTRIMQKRINLYQLEGIYF